MSEMTTPDLHDLLSESEERWRRWAWVLTTISIAFLCAGRILDKRATLLHNLRQHDMWEQADAPHRD